MREVPSHEKLLYRIEEAAAIASVARSTAYELINAGDWPVIRIGRSVRVPRAGLVAWVERVQQLPAAVA